MIGIGFYIRLSALIKVDPGVLKDCGPGRCARWSVRRAVSLDRTISDATRGSSRVMFDYREHCGAGPGVRARAPRGTQPSTPIARAGQSRLLGTSPEAAYLMERAHLTALPRVLPPVYEVLERVVDLYGYVSSPWKLAILTLVRPRLRLTPVL
jgi:hypothetical protein